MMQTATGAAFYGLAVDALLRTTEDCLEVTRLELVVPKACGAVVARFLALASQYTIASDDSEDNVAVLNIIVLECDTSNPLDVIARSPITSLYSAWTANELWIGYANLTASGVAYATSLNFPLLSPPSAHRKMWRVMRQCMQAGHVLSLRGHTCPHICGVDVSCPATLRTSCDAGCAISRFPVWRYSSESVASAPVCWSMGGGGLCARPSSQRSPHSPLEFQTFTVMLLHENLLYTHLSVPDENWRGVIRLYLQSTAPPSL
ncbi:hypothetical protein R3P38DRAFT_3211386 [Favolaschia claudopus]|uniref:Uncharacterized protein n=1 Tax=Favolaschia claudopus TaxID=2862362 RepID=A0AAW0AIW6_9AGAR